MHTPLTFLVFLLVYDFLQLISDYLRTFLFFLCTVVPFPYVHLENHREKLLFDFQSENQLQIENTIEYPNSNFTKKTAIRWLPKQ